MRKYDFKDAVTLSVGMPKGSTGLSVAQATIDAGKNDVQLMLAIGDKATIGDLALELEATVRVQNQAIKVTLPLPLKVAAK